VHGAYVNATFNFASHLQIFFFSDRILLRVKLLYFLRHEVIGKLGPKIKEGCNARFVIVNSFSFDLYGALGKLGLWGKCLCCGSNLVFSYV